jgi:hypothetical protein
MKRNVSEAEPERLAQQLASLSGLDGKSLKQRWLAQVTGSGKMPGDAFLYLSEPTLPMNQ